MDQMHTEHTVVLINDQFLGQGKREMSNIKNYECNVLHKVAAGGGGRIYKASFHWTKTHVTRQKTK